MRRSAGRRVAVRAGGKEEEFDPRQFRRELSKSENYNRRAAGDEEAINQMKDSGVWTTNEGATPAPPDLSLLARREVVGILMGAPYASREAAHVH